MNIFKKIAFAGAIMFAPLEHSAFAADSMEVRVPFAFIVAGQQFAAGEYRIQQDDSGVLLVRGSGQAAAIISMPAEIAKTGTKTGLRFRSDGDHEYLVGIQVEGETGRSVPVHFSPDRKLTLSQ